MRARAIRTASTRTAPGAGELRGQDRVTIRAVHLANATAPSCRERFDTVCVNVPIHRGRRAAGDVPRRRRHREVLIFVPAMQRSTGLTMPRSAITAAIRGARRPRFAAAASTS
jgi:hypothetical protein